MQLFESNVEFRIRPGSVYRENRLVPVVGAKAKGAYSFLNSIKRSTVKSEVLVCCLMLPDGSEGVFIDSEGKDRIISQKELEEKLTFINSKFRKTVIPRFLYKRGSKEGYHYIINKFLVSSDTSRRYKGWVSENGVIGEEVLTESYSPYKVGSLYVSDDGEFKFRVVSKSKGGYRILDVKENKKYNIDLSDISLMNPRKVDE